MIAIAIAALVVLTPFAGTSLAAEPGGTIHLEEFPPDLLWGGRTVAVDVAGLTTSGRIAAAATESGGLFLTENSGDTWEHVDTLPPHRLNDVAFAPGSSQVLIVTADADTRNIPASPVTYADGTTQAARTISGGGIWRSTNRGSTWTKVPSAEPPGSCPGRNSGRSSAFGIAFEPGTNNVYVGTHCGLAWSNDRGATWSHIPVNGARRQVASVVARDGVVDVCGSGGHFRLDPSDVSWQPDALGRSCGSRATHALAVSPAERDVLFVAARTTRSGCVTNNNPAGSTREIFESDDGGQSWTALNAPCRRRGRPPFAVTPPVEDGDFDVYFSNGADLYRQDDCLSSVDDGTRCSTGNWTRLPWVRGERDESERVDHADHSDLAFPPGEECPLLLSNDGGVERTVDCGRSFFNRGNASNGLHALQLFDVEGQILRTHTDLYIGTMDNDVWGSPDDGATWPNRIRFEGGAFSMAHRADEHNLIITGFSAAGERNFNATPHLASNTNWNNPPGWTSNPPSGPPALVGGQTYVQFGNAATGTLYLTQNAGGTWTQIANLGVGLSDRDIIHVSGPSSDPTVYVAASGGRLYRVTDLLPNPASTDVDRADTGISILRHFRGQGAWVNPPIVAVDPDDPDHLMASDAVSTGLVETTDGGDEWDPVPGITSLVTDNGSLRFRTRAPNCCSQVTAIAFDPVTDGRILVGTEANGIFASFDDGETWGQVEGSERVDAPTAFLFDEIRDVTYVSSYGSGLWKLFLPDPPDADRLESNDDADEATELTPDEAAELGGSPRFSHRHIRPPDAHERSDWFGETVEEWRWTLGDLTLHSFDDVDYFHLRLPDPQQGDADYTDLLTADDREAHPRVHTGMEECGYDEREIPPALAKVVERSVLSTGGELVASATTSVAGTVLPTDERVRIYRVDDDGTPGEELGSEIDCPRTREDLREVYVTFGERDADAPRQAFPTYSLSVVYRIHVNGIKEPADWVRPGLTGDSPGGAIGCGRAPDPGTFGAAGSGAGPGGLPPIGSLGGGFPYCDEPLVGIPHPGDPDCIADGPGCRWPAPGGSFQAHYPFNWPAEASLDLGVAASEDLNVELVGATEEAIATAQAVPDLQGLGSAERAGFGGQSGFSVASTTSPGAATSFQDVGDGTGDGTEDSLEFRRLTTDTLDPGYYALRVTGEAAQLLVAWDRPPEPADRDFDGVPDVFDPRPDSNHFEAAGDGDGSPDAPVPWFGFALLAAAAVGVGLLVGRFRWG